MFSAAICELWINGVSPAAPVSAACPFQNALSFAWLSVRVRTTFSWMVLSPLDASRAPSRVEVSPGS
ncbi:hypothetical protein DMP23_34825 [Amycolatopsis sp. A1MSW2902]